MEGTAKENPLATGGSANTNLHSKGALIIRPKWLLFEGDLVRDVTISEVLPV